MSSLRFNCGEFKPGKNPIIIPPRKKPSPGRIITTGGKIQNPSKGPTIPPPPPVEPGPPFVIPPTRGEDLYKCEVVGSLTCPEFDDEGDKLVTIEQGLKRSCVKCTDQEILDDLNNSNRTGLPRECVPLSECENMCSDVDPVCEKELTSIGGDGSTIFGEGDTGTGIQTTPSKTVGIRESINVSELSEGDRYRGVGKETVIDIEKEIESLEFSQTPGIPGITAPDRRAFNDVYHPLYTVFSFPEQEDTVPVTNDYYLDIFDDVVSSEVHYVLSRNGNSSVWHEFNYSKLSSAHIGYSLNKALLEALNNIYDVDNRKVPLNYFLETIKKLLVMNRLDDFDSLYYLALAEKQSSQDRTVVVESLDKTKKEKYALGVMAEDAEVIDPFQQEHENRETLKRYRPLLDQLEIDFHTEYYCGNNLVGGTIRVGEVDPHVSAICLAGDKNYIGLGDGYGYYLSCTNVCDEDLPVKSYNQVSSSFYAPADSRLFLLDQFSKPSSYRLTVSSEASVGEFEVRSSSFPSSIGEVGYFVLEGSSASSVPDDNALISHTTARYKLLTSQSEIDTHIKNHGFNVTIANIDYRDYFHHYAMAGGIFDLSLYDINYEAFYIKRSPIGGQTLLKHLPSAFILQPGKGSKHNPFGGSSELIEFEGDIIRELEFVPDIDWDSNYYGSLEDKYLGNQSTEYYIGLFEKLNPELQSMIYEYDPSSTVYSNSYFGNGEYSSTIPDISSSPQVTVVSLVEDTLKAKYDIQSDEYNVSSVTWWDVIRRMTADEYNSLSYEVNNSFYTKLSSGWRGIKVREILNRSDEDVETGLVSVVDESVSDTIILNDDDRMIDQYA
tara:strand:- start:621 stop:3125 length:2505 start_codon:yes stop_codon:yes gene_type:complete